MHELLAGDKVSEAALDQGLALLAAQLLAVAGAEVAQQRSR